MFNFKSFLITKEVKGDIFCAGCKHYNYIIGEGRGCSHTDNIKKTKNSVSLVESYIIASEQINKNNNCKNFIPREEEEYSITTIIEFIDKGKENLELNNVTQRSQGDKYYYVATKDAEYGFNNDSIFSVTSLRIKVK